MVLETLYNINKKTTTSQLQNKAFLKPAMWAKVDECEVLWPEQKKSQWEGKKEIALGSRASVGLLCLLILPNHPASEVGRGGSSGYLKQSSHNKSLAGFVNRIPAPWLHNPKAEVQWHHRLSWCLPTASIPFSGRMYLLPSTGNIMGWFIQAASSIQGLSKLSREYPN